MHLKLKYPPPSLSIFFVHSDTFFLSTVTDDSPTDVPVVYSIVKQLYNVYI